MTIARPWSCRAPATISDAEAEPPLISTTIGRPSIRSPRAGIEALDAVGAPPARRHDLAAVKERIGDRDRLLEQAARVVAQVEDHALQARAELPLESSIALRRLLSVCSLNAVIRM